MTRRNRSADEIVDLALRGCHIAIDASRNLTDLIETGSSAAFIEIRRCELELDSIESQIDDSITQAITRVNEPTARKLLVCAKISTDVERIGDLLWWSAQRLKRDIGPNNIVQADRADLRQISIVLEEMLRQIVDSFLARDESAAHAVMRRDGEIDNLRRNIFNRRLRATQDELGSTDVVLVAQALERAGDHTKNLAEAVLHLTEGRSMLHKARGRLEGMGA